MLLVIGPLFLILLIGFAFSGDDVHSITIGIKSADFNALQPVISNFSGIGTIHEYSEVEPCIEDMRLEKTHICIEFSDDFIKTEDNETIPSGQIVFYFDNTRKKISNAIVQELTEFMGITSEKISIESAKTIFANIEALVVFLDQRNSDIVVLVNESSNLKHDLTERRQKLVGFRDEFLPRYNKIKLIQSRINNITESVNSSYSEFIYELNLLDYELELLNYEITGWINPITLPGYYIYEINMTRYMTTNLSFLSLNNITFSQFNLTNFTFINRTMLNDTLNNDMIDISDISENDYRKLLASSIDDRINKVHSLVERATDSTTGLYNEFILLKTEFDSVIFQLDEFRIMLDSEIEATDIYLRKIDAAVIKIHELQDKLNENLVKLSKLNPNLAEKLIKPIVQSFEPLSANLKDINLVFPSLLSMIIVFISILFSNIVTLSEINSKAFFRNLITPVNDFIFTIGLIITNLVVVMFQVLVLLIVAEFKFRINVFHNIAEISFICIIFSLVFVFFGMIYAYLFNNEQTSILVTTFTAIAFYLFSDAITPLETMPMLASRLASLNPFVFISSVFKKIILFDIPLFYMQKEMIILLLYFLVSLILLVAVSKVKNKRQI
ncbi:ABC transporter permease [Candidatus Woesearchaeota archaeon]|nr:ABC transporter permease [Candidatus Woesearchaeota archaeon]